MRSQKSVVLTFSLCTLLVIAGCGKTSSKSAAPAKSDGGHSEEEHHGPHKGMLFDVGREHKVLGELVVSKEPRKIELYLLDHEDNKKAVMSTSETITITSIKADGKPVADITLTKAPLTGEKDSWSHWVLEGDKIPKELEEDHDFIGAKFSVAIGGKQVLADIIEH